MRNTQKESLIKQFALALQEGHTLKEPAVHCIVFWRSGLKYHIAEQSS
jgi:hypothetical protein